MSLQVLAVVALLVGGTAVLTVVATTPSPAAPLTPARAPPSNAPSLGSTETPGAGQLDLVVHNTEESAVVTIRVVSDAGQAVFDEQVTLPARDDWTRTLQVAPDLYDVRLEAANGYVAQDGDLRACDDLHAISTMTTTFRPANLGVRFKGEGVLCADGSPAGDKDPPEGPGKMRGTARVGVAYTGLPGPGCVPPGCRASYSYLSGTVGFELEAPAHVVVRAFWEPTTPASERLAVSLSRDLGEGRGEGVGGGEGASEIVFEVEAEEPGMYRLMAWPAGPVGVAVMQDVNYEVTWTPV